MGSPPTQYSSKVAVPLPKAEQLSASAIRSVQQAHGISVAWAFAGTGEMLDGVQGLIQAVFTAKGIDPKLRELIILHSAYLLDSPYEWQANSTMARNTGATDAEIAAMTTDGPVTGLGDEADLVLEATDELTRDATLEDATLQRLLNAYDDVTVRKLILIISWFNLLARFLNGCRVPMETSDELGTATSPLG